VKVVLDTNVMLSGLARPQSIPGRILAAWDLHSFQLVSSQPQVAEITRVFGYPKVRTLLGWGEPQIERFLRQLLLRLELVALPAQLPSVPRDPDDAPILATLLAAEADVLVTGDRDLLSLSDKYPIESPVEFLQRL
jgi:putative PIN family toxin of toxin-antitoxin system